MDMTTESPAIRRLPTSANTWWSTATNAIDIAKQTRQWWLRHRTWTLSVTSDDPCYPDIQDWLLAHVPVHRQRALAVRSRYDSSITSDDAPQIAGSSESDQAMLRLVVTSDAEHEQRIIIDGHPIHVSLARGEASANAAAWAKRVAPDRIIFRATSYAGQRVVLDHLHNLVERHKRSARRPQLWMLSSWGSWVRRSDIPLRTPESVILRAGQMETLIADLEAFLAGETEHTRRGLPWHRGYLLQGPPGTGKTSIAKALATLFGLDLWHVPLGDLDTDANLLTLVAEVRPRSLLLLEDVDIYQAASSRSAEKNHVTLSGLLNALDGVGTPHGLITVLTSNAPDVLDPALIRPGRIDRIEDVDYLDTEQARRLFVFFYARPPRRDWSISPATSSAELTELFKQHLNDPDEVETVLCARSQTDQHRGQLLNIR